MNLTIPSRDCKSCLKVVRAPKCIGQVKGLRSAKIDKQDGVLQEFVATACSDVLNELQRRALTDSTNSIGKLPDRIARCRDTPEAGHRPDEDRDGMHIERPVQSDSHLVQTRHVENDGLRGFRMTDFRNTTRVSFSKKTSFSQTCQKER